MTDCGPSSLIQGAPWELKQWQQVDRKNCTCSGSTKTCTLSMQKQNLPWLVISSPRDDAPAYVAMEIDNGVYGKLRHAFGTRAQARWVDIGANLGMLSIALALANPTAIGWTYEPNPSTFAHLQANIAANGLADRLQAINAGVSGDGRAIFMPKCVVDHPGGSQMASTQWDSSSKPVNRCFSGSCNKKQGLVERCMKLDPTMLRIPSVTLDEAFGAAGVPLGNGSSAPDGAPRAAGRHGGGGGFKASGRAFKPWRAAGDASPDASLSLLKVDCEGCEHEIMHRIDGVQQARKVHRVSHALKTLTQREAAMCLRVLRGQTCKHGISPWLSCNNK